MGDSARKLDSQNEVLDPGTDQKYIPIPIVSFMGGQSAPADIYIRLLSGKYVCVAKKNQPFSVDRLTKYQEHNVTHLYFDPKQYGDYVESCLDISRLISNNEKASPIQRSQILVKASETVMSELKLKKFDKVALDHAQVVCQNMLDVCNTRPALASLLKQFEALGEDFAKHSLGVSFISLMLAQKMGWKGIKAQQALSLAGLLHDIGKKELPTELLNKPRTEWTRSEVLLYESHPDRGRDILVTLNELPVEVITIVHQHHEMPGQRGFPQKLSRDRLYPLSRVTALANLMANTIMKTNAKPNPMDAEEGYTFLQSLYGSSFDNPLWEALKKCIEAPAP
jgi:putative nucleotidyltransferase with HDIG domain